MNPKKKILFLITKATWGGAQKYVFDFATTLPKNSYDVIVAYGSKGKLASDLLDVGIKARRLDHLGRDIAIISDFRSFFEIFRTIKELDPDVIHLNSSKAAALGAIAAYLAGTTTIVFTVHGWPFKEARNFLARLLMYLASWMTALASDRIVVVSRGDEKIGRRMWFVAQKISYIPLGRRSLELVTPSEGFAKMFATLSVPPITAGTLRIVTIAELAKNKGIRFGIDAIRELADRGIDPLYVVVGEGEDAVFLKSYANERGVADRVFFPGFVLQAARYLSGFDIFLLPSLKEGMPNVLLEASAAGLPIVATTAIDEDDAAQFPAIRITPTGDSLALADAIIEVAKRPRTQTRTAATSVSEMVERTLVLYRR